MSPVTRKAVFGGFLTRYNTNLAVQLQKMARGLIFQIWEVKELTIYKAKTKALISCVVIMQLICGFVFAYANSTFSHDMAEMSLGKHSKC